MFRIWLNRFFALFRKASLDQELEEEIRTHLDFAIEENMRLGMSADEANAQARRSFGGMESVKEEYREQRGVPFLDAVGRDIRFAVRTLVRTLAFTAVVTVTLGIGIGANTAIFSLIDAVLLKPLPFREPERLAILWEDASRFGYPKNTLSVAGYLDWKSQSKSFEDLAAFHGDAFTLTDGGVPERLDVQCVTANLFPILGIKPAHGRWFLESEDSFEATPVVILSHGLWQRRFGSEPGLIGRSIRLKGQSHVVVGVMPPGFQFPHGDTQAWVPIALSPRRFSERSNSFLTVVGRLKQGITWERAQAEMEAVAAGLAKVYPDTNKDRSAVVAPLHTELVKDVRRAFWILLAASGLVLVIACANVASLLVTRGLGRQRELAIRSALGASRSQVARQLLVEALLLAGLGSGLGLLSAAWVFRFLETLIPPSLSGAAQLTLDVRLLGFTFAVSLLTGIACGLVPFRRAFRVDFSESLRGRTRAVETRDRSRAFLVALETALAVVVVVCTGLMIRTLLNLHAIDPGFRPGNVLTMRLELAYRYRTVGDLVSFYHRVLDGVHALPGVESAGFTTFLPYTNFGGSSWLTIEGRPELPDIAKAAYRRIVSPDYLRTIGVPLRSGRWFSEQDDENHRLVAIVNERGAELFNGDPLGKRIKLGDPRGAWLTVVGVVGDIREEGLEAPSSRPTVYLPYTQMQEVWYFNPRDLAIRTHGDPIHLIQAVQKAVWAVDPHQSISNVRAMDVIVEGQLSHRRIQTILLGSFSVLALLLAALGVYALLSFVVAERTEEFGIRMALGAQRSDVVGLVFRRSLAWVGGGAAAGAAASLVATRTLASLLYGVSPTDPYTVCGVVALLIMIGSFASCLPALRATRVDPAVVLHEQ